MIYHHWSLLVAEGISHGNVQQRRLVAAGRKFLDDFRSHVPDGNQLGRKKMSPHMNNTLLVGGFKWEYYSQYMEK
jgi:hypothetical protein